MRQSGIIVGGAPSEFTFTGNTIVDSRSVRERALDWLCGYQPVRRGTLVSLAFLNLFVGYLFFFVR